MWSTTIAIATGSADPAPVSFFVDLVRQAAERTGLSQTSVVEEAISQLLRRLARLDGMPWREQVDAIVAPYVDGELPRTDPAAEKRQEGISFLLIDMTTPGITVRPLILMDGGHEVNEVFFDDVKVPVVMSPCVIRLEA